MNNCCCNKKFKAFLRNPKKNEYFKLSNDKKTFFRTNPLDGNVRHKRCISAQTKKYLRAYVTGKDRDNFIKLLKNSPLYGKVEPFQMIIFAMYKNLFEPRESVRRNGTIMYVGDCKHSAFIKPSEYLTRLSVEDTVDVYYNHSRGGILKVALCDEELQSEFCVNRRCNDYSNNKEIINSINDLPIDFPIDDKLMESKLISYLIVCVMKYCDECNFSKGVFMEMISEFRLIGLLNCVSPNLIRLMAGFNHILIDMYNHRGEDIFKIKVSENYILQLNPEGDADFMKTNKPSFPNRKRDINEDRKIITRITELCLLPPTRMEEHVSHTSELLITPPTEME